MSQDEQAIEFHHGVSTTHLADSANASRFTPGFIFLSLTRTRSAPVAYSAYLTDITGTLLHATAFCGCEELARAKAAQWQELYAPTALMFT